MSPGVVIDRRMFISAAVLASAAGSSVLASALAAEAPADNAFSSLMQRLQKIGAQLPAVSAAEQNAYIYRLAATAMLVDRFPMPKLEAYGKTAIEIGPLGRTDPADRIHGVALVAYRMAPGALLEPHNHPHYSVTTIGIEGEAEVRHFEPAQDAPPMTSRERFVVRKTAQRVIRPGEASTLTPSRDNVHTFRAGPQGARLVDLFSIHGDDVGFAYLNIAAQPTVSGGDTHVAQWIGDRPSNF
jgi:hypothetical protein